MEFEFDQDKSAANKRKHGIDFVEAQALWNDNDAIEMPAQTTHEKRYAVVGTFHLKHWTAIVTYRNEKVRLISVRRSWKKEIEAYEKSKKNQSH